MVLAQQKGANREPYYGLDLIFASPKLMESGSFCSEGVRHAAVKGSKAKELGSCGFQRVNKN